MVRILLIILMLYIGYKFIFHFLLPVMRVSRQMKDQVRNFQNRMDQENENVARRTTSTGTAGSRKEGDYIDYEEVK